MLLSKVGSHDALKEENASLKRELADKTAEVSRLQSQAGSSGSRVAQQQEDLDRVSAELATCQVSACRDPCKCVSKARPLL